MDIAFGGMFYAVVQTDSVDELPNLLPENGKRIATLGCSILVKHWAKTFLILYIYIYIKFSPSLPIMRIAISYLIESG